MTTMMRTALALSEGKHLVEDGWCKNIRRDHFGNVCALGAVDAGDAYNNTPLYHSCVELLFEAMTESERRIGAVRLCASFVAPENGMFGNTDEYRRAFTIAMWNNHYSVTKEDIIDLFDRAYTIAIRKELDTAVSAESLDLLDSVVGEA